MKALLFLALLALSISPARALEFKTGTHQGKVYTVCRVDTRTDQLRLFLRGDQGEYLKSFEGIDRALAPRGQRLLFGMNAGMFHPGLIPVGWFVAGGTEVAPLTLAEGEGNFFMKPNGVFLLTERGAQVVVSSQAAVIRELKEKVLLATQSGPMLVIDGNIHPAFKPQSDSLLFRNGVGIASPHDVVFAISEGPVNFYEFATLFRDTLHCRDALFLDGTLSSLHSPELKRSDKKIDLGPMIGVVGPLPAKPLP